jgi:imidazole glycerol-phosphate synthase subunit HisF
MFRPRVIPVLSIGGDGHAVKTIKFKKRIDLGDPVNSVSLFNSFRVDELVLLDIDATKENRTISFDLLADIASEAKMPFSVGGGVRSLADIRKILSSGAEKVVISSAAAARPEFVREAAEKFASSSIVVCIDVKKTLFGKEAVWAESGKKKLDSSPREFALLMEKMGAGEIIIQSIDHDGAMTGYDDALIKDISAAVSVPVIALGGAGRLDHMTQLYASSSVSALAAGSLFCFQNADRGVLINYPSKEQLRRFMRLRD